MSDIPVAHRGTTTTVPLHTYAQRRVIDHNLDDERMHILALSMVDQLARAVASAGRRAHPTRVVLLPHIVGAIGPATEDGAHPEAIDPDHDVLRVACGAHDPIDGLPAGRCRACVT